MLKGRKVAHRFFTSEEYIFMKNGIIFSEDGVCQGSTFWCGRNSEEWQTDWRIVE